MASDMTFEASVLSDAVKATFERRETEINDVVLTVFGEVFINDEGKQKQWKAFLSRNALKSEMSFADLMVKLKQFLEPVYQLASSNEVIEEYWSSEEWQWKQR